MGVYVGCEVIILATKNTSGNILHNEWACEFEDVCKEVGFLAPKRLLSENIWNKKRVGIGSKKC